MNHKIKILPSGKTIHGGGKKSLKEILEKNGFVFPHNCGGGGNCNSCRVHFISGLPQAKDIEIQKFGAGSDLRLSCMHQLDEDITIRLPRVSESLAAKKLSDVKIDSDESGYAIGVDLGTTTLALYLVDLSKGIIIAQHSALNPQINLGSDVISRLEMAKTEQGLDQLSKAIRDGLSEAAIKLIQNVVLDKREIRKVSIAGNSVMTHLFLGVSAAGLERVPFISPLQDEDRLDFDPRILNLHEETVARLYPVLSGFIGGDTAAAIVSEGLDQGDDTRLLVDLGTNGEIVLSKNGKLFATSTAAGPAFDGMGMQSGMPALKGAIEDIDRSSGLKIIGNSDPKGICGSGYIALIAHLLKTKKMNCNGLLEEDKQGQRIWQPQPGNPDVVLTQEDIRRFQLAKGAVAAGIGMICRQADVRYDEISQTILTGSFGNRINIGAALTCGLLPEIKEETVIFSENAAGRGAVIALAGDEIDKRIASIRQKIQFINLGDHPDFQDNYVTNMLFPVIE